MAEDAAAFADAEARAAAGDDVPPQLAWWTWERPTISVGRLQDPAADIDRAAAAAAGIPVVVRPTGGRAILHADEWTYRAIVRLDDPALGGSRDAATRAIVVRIGRALGEACGLALDPPAPERARGVPGGPGAATACFARAHGYELTAGGRKLMGSAQRRGRHVLLQQGSLLVGPGHERLGRYLPLAAAERAAAEAGLARAATSLGELLGARPEQEPFRAALAGAFADAAAGATHAAERSS